jgi:prolyl-tRNA synthetase
MLDEINKSMYKKALDFLKANTHRTKTYDEFKKQIEKGGIFQVSWCGGRECEDKIKEDTKAKIVNIPFDQPKAISDCVICGKKGKIIVNVAKSY